MTIAMMNARHVTAHRLENRDDDNNKKTFEYASLGTGWIAHAFGSSAASEQGATRNKSFGGEADHLALARVPLRLR